MNIVALSGGADSVAVFHKYLNEIDAAVHVNYNLRGAESLRDEALCRDLCKQFNKPIQVFTFSNVDELAKQASQSLEEYARNLRYSIFNDSQYTRIYLGHHKDDLAETIIFRLIRGTGLNGILPMQEVNGKYYRPLLQYTKDEILKYISDNNLSYITDSSNLSNDYSRNIIRNQIMPLMKQIHPSAVSNIVDLASIAKETSNEQIAQLEPIIKALLTTGVPRQTFNALSQNAKHTALLSAAKQLSPKIFSLSKSQFAEISRMMIDSKSGAYKLMNGVYYAIRKEQLFMRIKRESDPIRIEFSAISQDNLSALGIKELRIFSEKVIYINGYRFDISSIHKLVIRHPDPNDYVKVDGMTKPIGRYLGDKGIFNFERNQIPVLTCGHHVLWAAIGGL